MTKKTSLSTRQKQYAKVDQLSKIIIPKLETIFNAFNIEYYRDKKCYIGPCPIHQGDKNNAWNFYYGNNGYWKCRTRGCEEIFKSSVIGFIRGLLSKENGWLSESDTHLVVSFSETLKFCEELIGKSFSNIEIDETLVERDNYNNIVNIWNYSPKQNITTNVDKKYIRSKLEIPATYFLKRGFSADILDKYDVGLCLTDKCEMSNRVVVPVYDSDHKYMVGCTGRSIYPLCNECKCYHPLNKHQSKELRSYYSKWKHSSNLKTEHHLYNYWFAEKYIRDSGIAVIVESPGNVWRLEEAGIHNSVAIFGTNLSWAQYNLLYKAGAIKLAILTDNDLPGKLAAFKIMDHCSNGEKGRKQFNCKMINITKNDVGEMSINDINNEILPKLKDFV